jgi:hypothetical protein
MFQTIFGRKSDKDGGSNSNGNGNNTRGYNNIADSIERFLKH